MPIIPIITAASSLIPAAGNVVRKQREANMNDYLVQQCGKRPLFPGRRREAYEECVNNALTSWRPTNLPPGFNPGNAGAGNFTNITPNVSPNQGGTPPPSGTTEGETFFQKYKTPLLIGGAAIAAFLIFKKK